MHERCFFPSSPPLHWNSLGMLRPTTLVVVVFSHFLNQTKLQPQFQGLSLKSIFSNPIQIFSGKLSRFIQVIRLQRRSSDLKDPDIGSNVAAFKEIRLLYDKPNFSIFVIFSSNLLASSFDSLQFVRSRYQSC